MDTTDSVAWKSRIFSKSIEKNFDEQKRNQFIYCDELMRARLLIHQTLRDEAAATKKKNNKN